MDLLSRSLVTEKAGRLSKTLTKVGGYMSLASSSVSAAGLVADKNMTMIF